MPGPSNTPKPMTFDASRNWFIAEGIPITPYDDAGNKNPYPLMKVTARDVVGDLLASTRIVLPVSDEMDCRGCHASGSRAGRATGCGLGLRPEPRAGLSPQRPPAPRRAAGVEPGLRVRRSRRPATTRPGSTPTVTVAATGDPLRDVPLLRGAPRERAARHSAAHPGDPLAPRRRDGPDERAAARRVHEPLGLLPLPSRLGRRSACAARWARRRRPTARC